MRHRFPRLRLLLPVAAFAALLGTLAPSAAAEELRQKPILRIEAGMHTAAIRRIAVDAASRYLVTGSHDKTVRVWELQTGRLLQTLRVPIGEGNEGKVYAVAITPNGSAIACGGWSADDDIYLFDRASGRLLRRISGLRDVVNDLAYSPDGRFLAATLGGNNGLRVFRTSDGALAAEDKDYDDNGYGVHFDRAGRLVTTCYDGFVRLYDAGFRLLAKRQGPGGSRPFSARFSPDGSKVAVGYVDSRRVDVLSGSDLAPLYAPDTSGVNNGDLSSVAWSADGGALWAGGRWADASDLSPLRRWPQAGRGAFTDLRAAYSTIMDLRPVSGGGIAFGAADPAFGLFDAGGTRTRFQTGAIADYRGLLPGFLVAADGAAVQFGYQPSGKLPARFAVNSRQLNAELPVASPTNGLAPPLTQTAGGPGVTGWKNTFAPKLGGKPLALTQYETSRSLALTRDGQSFLLGTNWYLRLFDRSGNERWSVPTPGEVWSVNIAGSGRVAVAALGDGTIRWYRAQDGKELLAFFPHADRKRWVLWTPGGYFDASPGGEDLIGWHLNNGGDRAADFFPASRFRGVYYRPDVIARVLGAGGEDEALRLANEESGRKQPPIAVEQALPPVVRILSPADGATISATQITLRCEVRSPANAPVTGVKALVDGRPVEAGKRLVAVPADADNAAERTLTVTIPERDCEVSILVQNRFAASTPATIRVRWGGAPEADASVLKPRLYVLAIGVSKYANPSLALEFPAKDARDFAGAMLGQKGALYRDVIVKILTDGQATKEAILDGLEWIQKQTTSRDMAMVFLSGHGANDPNGVYHFLPVGFDPERFKSTGVPFSDLKATLEALAGKTLFFVDSCHSGNVLGTARARGGTVDVNSLVNELASAENGCVVYASSTGRQVSLEDPAWNNGAFTKALVEGLGGKADLLRKGKITVNLLDAYVSERVKELTGGRQTPATSKPQTVPDFPIAVPR